MESLPEKAAGWLAHAGLFLVALATLMLEVLLTRIFSVTMWYHFAFLAISVAMFGMTAGALLVYLRPAFFTPARAKAHMSVSGALFATSAIVGLVVHAVTPFRPAASLHALPHLLLTYVAIALPFTFSGVCVCLALTRFPRQVSTLYAADLTGAALGCVALVLALRVTDGPTAAFVVSALAAAGAVAFALEGGSPRLMRASAVLALSLAVVAAGHTVLVRRQHPLLRLLWAKGNPTAQTRYEVWNSFSRVRVGSPDTTTHLLGRGADAPTHPLGWGMSPVTPDCLVPQLLIDIDSTASTILTGFDGDLDRVQYLKWDVTNLAHHLRSHARVAVIGVGGGRDLLSALAFEQQSVTGIEINGNILDILTDRFGDYAGHLERNPKVTLVSDEARSYLARQHGWFDIIQMSLVDTYAATAAGAFVLSENSLYTVQAWKLLLSRLSPNGILTVSRWYNLQRPGEAYRTTALAAQALLELGVRSPREHLMLIRCMPPASQHRDGVVTLLASPRPFSPQDVAQAEAVARRMQFEVVLSPKYAENQALADALTSGSNLTRFTAAYPLDISPPTDDRPFFFHMARPRDLLQRRSRATGNVGTHLQAVRVLGLLLITVVVLTLACLLLPLWLTARRGVTRGHAPFFLFFGSIGLGFMFIEISQMQRLIVLLGHPTYGLTVILFALLLSSGLGSRFTQGVEGERLARAGAARLGLLLLGLAAFGLLTPYVVATQEGATTPVRIGLAIALLFPLGLLLGAPFPLGLKLAAAHSPQATPWLWGINGAASVLASVLAVVVALYAGITASFWTGVGCYALALLSFVWAARPAKREAGAPATERDAAVAGLAPAVVR